MDLESRLYTAYTVDTVYNNETVYTVYTVQTASHCLNRSMFVFIYCIFLGKVRTLLEWADALLSKMLDDWTIPLL